MAPELRQSSCMSAKNVDDCVCVCVRVGLKTLKTVQLNKECSITDKTNLRIRFDANVVRYSLTIQIAWRVVIHTI